MQQYINNAFVQESGHNFKTGFQLNWGPYYNTRDSNADLQQVYANGVPETVTVYDTPLEYHDQLNADVGIFAQDSWTLNRLTVNGGIRWEYLSSKVSARTSGAGRFIAARDFGDIQMPVWKNFAPRFGVIYDLFGNAKTALKFGMNKYNESRTTLFANAYNPLRPVTANLTWNDLNRDDIAERDSASERLVLRDRCSLEGPLRRTGARDRTLRS